MSVVTQGRDNDHSTQLSLQTELGQLTFPGANPEGLNRNYGQKKILSVSPLLHHLSRQLACGILRNPPAGISPRTFVDRN